MARIRSSGKKTALGGVLTAGSLALIWLASVAPSGRLGLTAAAGLFPVAGVLSGGPGVGYLCWAAAGILSLLLVPDKGTALLYLLFFGLYPVVKSRMEGLHSRWREWGLKLVFFNAVLTLCWFLFRVLLLPDPPQWLTEHLWLLYGGGNLIFVCYDVGLTQLIGLIHSRIGGRLR